MRSWLQRFAARKPAAPKPEEDAALARRALTDGDLPHAAFHIGCALVHDPLRAEWLELLERLAALEPDPLALTPSTNDGGVYFATAAVRGWLMERLGRLDEGLGLTLSAVGAKPDAGALLEWPIRWLEARAGQGDVDLEPVTVFLAGLPTERPASLADRLPRLIRASAGAAAAPDPAFTVTAARTLRELGALDDALALAEAGWAASPGYMSAVALGANRRGVGDFDGARDAYEAALAFQPDDPGVLLDLGDLLFDDGQLDAALARYDAALGADPDNAWARASRLGVLREQGDAAAGEALEGLSAGGDPRARALVRDLPWIDLLPAPREAIVEVAQRLLADGATDIERLTLSAVEAPSAVLSVERELARAGLSGIPEIVVQKIARPDPRQPRRSVRWLLWRYEGSRAAPNLPPPSPEIAAAVADLARRRYQLEVWSARARRLAARVGGDALPDLLACPLHPPDAPEGMRFWDWDYRLHVAAALVAAHIAPADLRRDALLSLAYGPLDWSNEAAAIGLLAAAQRDPNLWDEATAAFRAMVASPPRPGFVGYLLPVAVAWLHAPDLDSRTRRQLERLIESAGG